MDDTVRSTWVAECERGKGQQCKDSDDVSTKCTMCKLKTVFVQTPPLTCQPKPPSPPRN